MTDTEVREFLHRMADEAGSDLVDPRPVVQKVRRRAAFTAAGTLLTVGALVAGGIVGANRLATTSTDRTQKPANPGPTVRVPASPGVDYVIDLDTGEMTSLPSSPQPFGEMIRDRSTEAQYAVSRSSSACSPPTSWCSGKWPTSRPLLAWVAPKGKEGTPQIFVAPLGCEQVLCRLGGHQLTHDPKGATSPAWSQDGTTIAYVGYGEGDLRKVFVLDVATGESTQVTADEPNGDGDMSSPQFTPDGSSLVYCGLSPFKPALLTVPVAGGSSAILFGHGRGGMADACGGSLSPDGSLVTMMGSAVGSGGAIRFVANADGTGQPRQISGRGSNPAGTWSPDGTRIVCSNDAGGILVVDVATGNASLVAEGRAAIWLDDHTLLVEV